MNRKIRVLLFSIITLVALLNLTANAQSMVEQKFTVANNGEIQAFASKGEITRVVFEQPVTEIHAISEEIEYAINGKDIYLRLLAEKPVNFFVKTEDEMSYKFVLLEQDIPATQIFIHNQNLKVMSVAKTEYFAKASSELKNRIAKLIEVSLSPTKYLGFNITPKNLNLTSPVKALKMKLVGKITGNMLIAEKIYLTNKSDVLQKLNLKDFADQKYLAAYLAKTELLPKEECVLIRVLEN